MAISREDIGKIAKEAANKVTVSKRCKELGEMLLDVKQDLWNAMDNLQEKFPYSLEVAKIWAEGAKRLYMTPFWTREFTTEELVLLNAPVEKGLKLIEEKKDLEASLAFEEARKAAHELLFQKVVECECGEAKAIEEKFKERMPRIDPHATAIQQDKQLVEQMKWLKARGFKTAREAQEAGY